MIQIPIRCLTYGPSGTGKTAMALTFPLDTDNGEWGYVFDFDKGLNTWRNPLTGALPKGWYAHTYLDAVRISGQSGIGKVQRQHGAFTAALNFLMDLFKGLDEDARKELGLPANANPHPTIILVDTLSGLHDCAANAALSLDPKAGLGGALARQHYLALMHYVSEFTKMVEGGPWHLLVTAHEVTEKDEASGVLMSRIVATGQATPGLYPGYFDEMYHHEVQRGSKGTRYLIRTKASGAVSAKTRIGSDLARGVDIFDEIEDVTIESGQPSGWPKLLSKLADYYKML